MATKVVYNYKPGGFGLSKAAINVARALFNVEWEHEYPERHDPRLVRLVGLMGEAVNGDNADLVIKEIEGNSYRIVYHNNGLEEVEIPEDIYWTVVGEDQ